MKRATLLCTTTSNHAPKGSAGIFAMALDGAATKAVFDSFEVWAE